MKRLLVLALASAGAAAAPLDMALFQSQDVDRDGYVDLVEVAASIDLQARFNDIDTDRDGRISAAEMQRWLDRSDRRDALQTASPVHAHEQWRAIEAERRQREAQRVERILGGENVDEATPARGAAAAQ